MTGLIRPTYPSFELRPDLGAGPPWMDKGPVNGGGFVRALSMGCA